MELLKLSWFSVPVFKTEHLVREAFCHVFEFSGVFFDFRFYVFRGEFVVGVGDRLDGVTEMEDELAFGDSESNEEYDGRAAAAGGEVPR